MNLYKVMKDRHQKEFNEFPMQFAFGKQQFEEAMKNLGLEPTDTDKIYTIGGGGFYLRSEAHKLHEILDRQEKEMKEAMKNDQFIYDMFSYELGNHEYVITYDVSDALGALGLTYEEVENDERLRKALEKACKAEKDWYRKNG